MPEGRIPLEELASLPTFAAVTPSWGRDRVAFYWDRTGRFELYTLDLRTRDLKQVTDGQAPRALRAGFVWTRDDREIVFARDRDGDEQNNLFKLDVETGAVVQLNDDPRTQEYAGEVHPDNALMAVMSNRAGQMNVFTLDLRQESHEWRQLTRFASPAFAGRWSPDGRWLAFGANESANLKNQDAYLVSVDGAETRKVLSVRDGSQDAINDWHPDGRRVSVTSDASGASRAGLLDLETFEIAWLGEPREGVEEYAGGFSRDGEWLSVVRSQDSAYTPLLYRVATGEARELKLPAGIAGGASFVLDDTKLLLTHASSSRRAELVLYDLQTDTSETLLAAEYGSIDPALFVTDEYLRYPSFDGQSVPAILYAPHGAKPGDRLPALVVVHGGPTAQWFRGFDPYAQFLVDRGYVVLEPNVRGSTGYGTAWRDAALMDWGGGDLEDVVAGANYLKSLPYVDPERVGVFGGSYGGFMSFIAVTKRPGAFKVGVPWVGISDLHLLYEEDMEHFKYYLRQQMGDPEENRALWRDRSAVEFAQDLEAKLMIVHGLNDPRCPISQARVFRDRLLALGRREGRAPEDDFEYHEIGDEGHGAGDIQGKIRTYRLLADFLDRRL
jgi:dipeptidyl aminopeptidase/acylaminoacyl peptidase